ncbi:hypothetical protein ZWY2020_028799 [Hordeum vulgare]|nr:hypothetical protein ZWY2020_028799 [Hordeum vulgare]
MTKGQTSKLEARKKKKAAARQQQRHGGLDPGGFPPLHGDEGGHAGAGGARHDRGQDVEAAGGGRDGAGAPGGGARPAAQSCVPRLLSASSSLLQRAATSATSLPCQGDDPMDTDNVVTSQQEVIHVEEDDQKRSEQAATPVLEAVPSVTTPAMDAPPTEMMPSTDTALIIAEPTGAGLGMPKESLVVPDFCMDAEAEAADVERSVIPNVPLGDDANRDMLRVHIRLGKVGPFIGRLREVVGRIDKELWPEDESRQEMEGLMTRLEDVPNRVQAWKKSAPCRRALSLVRVHCKEAREEKLKALQVANTKKLRFEDFMETFLESATRIADGIDLDTFVEPADPVRSGDA